MKIEIRKKLPIAISVIIISILTIIFASLSLVKTNNLAFRILTQGCLGVVMILQGVNSFIYQKQKVIGIYLWLIAVFIISVMCFTIYVGLQTKGFN